MDPEYFIQSTTVFFPLPAAVPLLLSPKERPYNCILSSLSLIFGGEASE